MNEIHECNACGCSTLIPSLNLGNQPLANSIKPNTEDQPKYPLAEFSKDDKIVFMPLAWNFFTEIRDRIKTVRDEPHDLFLKYFPHVETNNE